MKDYSDFFPYPEFKPLQLNAMDFVSSVVEKKAIGLVEAYCGFGKTIATFAPVLAAGKKVLLLTPSYSARNAATAEALKINKLKGQKLLIADLRAKQVMCKKFETGFFSHEACLNAVRIKQNCEFFSNTFLGKTKNFSALALSAIEKIESDTADSPEVFFGTGIIEKEPVFFQRFEKICEKQRLCSYEIMKKIIEDADIVILDYFWCFTGIYNILQKIINPKEFVLLIDEADMLIDRLYNEFQVQLSIVALQKLFRQAQILEKNGSLQKTDLDFLEEFVSYTQFFLDKNASEKPLRAENVLDFFVSQFQENAKKQGLEGTIDLNLIIKNLSTIVETILSSEEFEKAGARPDSFLFHLEKIKDSSQYLVFIPKTRNRILAKPFEINNVTLANNLSLSETLKQFDSSILFSATLGDPVLLQEELGLNPKETMVFKTSSMPHQNLLLLIDTELNTTFKARERNFVGFKEKINAIRSVDNSLLVGCCNSFETEKFLKEIPFLENAEFSDNLSSEQGYALNIRTKHARSTNKAKNVRNCIIVGLPLPDYSDFYFQQRKGFLEAKYGSTQAGKLLNRKAVDTAVQLMGRITRDLSSPKTITLADSRYKKDFFLGSFYYETIPDYLKQFSRTIDSTQKLRMHIKAFWEEKRE